MYSKGLIPFVFAVHLPIIFLWSCCRNSGTVSSPEPKLVSAAMNLKSAHVVLQQEDASETVEVRCKEGMVHVHGSYCPKVEQKCLEWLDDASASVNGAMRCARFAPSVCLSRERVEKDFCIDKFEYPNVEGEEPKVASTWIQAAAVCEEQGKRLCTDSEWTFACEGEEMRPYPYGETGLERDESACDQTHDPMPNPTAPKSEWSKHYPGHASGSFEKCTSPSGAFDMVSGVDEWVVNESGKPFKSGLKGGYGTNRVRTRCRPMTTAHGPSFSFYNVGFRCCA